MRPRAVLKPHQVEAARRLCERHRHALLLEVGDGKTAATLTALLDLHAWPALVVAPALVVEADVWGDEARSWEHLADLRVVPLVGTSGRRMDLLDEEGHVEVVSYECYMWLTEVEDVGERYAAVVWDELSAMKHPGTKRFKRARSKLGGVDISVRAGLTASPAGNHLMDAWGEMYAVAGAAPLGPTHGAFVERYFEATDYMRRQWALKGMERDKRGRPVRHTAASRALEREIHARIAPWAYCRPPRAPRPGVPPVRVVARRLPVPPTLERALRELRRQLWTRLPSGAELEVAGASAAAQKARQLAGGAVYLSPPDAEDGAPGPPFNDRRWEVVHDVKLRWLNDLLDELQGAPCVVYYWYEHELERVAEALNRAGRRWSTLEGGLRTRETLAAWDRGELEVLLLHPQSGGRGLNLQRGGHHVAWFTLPWSRETLDQGDGRVARTGQPAPEVVSHRPLLGPVDEDVAAVLARKGKTEYDLKAAVARLGKET